MRVRRRGATLVGALVAVALGATGCGDDDDGGRTAPDLGPVVGQGLPPEVEHPSAAAIDELQRAFVERDYARICAGITSEAAEDAGKAGHGNPTTCRADVRRMLGMIRDGGGFRHAGQPRVIDVEEAGSKAVVTVALDRRWKARVPMSKVGGRWRLSGFFGTSLVDADRAAKEIEQSDFPAATGTPVAATKADGSPCPAMSEARFPWIDGGCVINVKGTVAPFTILTALGDFKFDDCSLDYRIHVDPAGRTWIDRVHVDWGDRGVACGDVNPCQVSQADAPWRGRLYPSRDGSFIHRTNMCMVTCVGAFIGELRMRLVREGNAWRALPVDGSGDSGLRFDNALKVRGDFDLSTQS